jgi:hypothetical protein
MDVARLSIRVDSDQVERADKRLESFHRSGERAQRAAQGFGRKAADAFGRLESAGQSLSTFVTLPLAAAGGAAVKTASDLQESMNAVNVVFGESAEVIKDWGENAATQAGLSQAAFNQAATTIGAALNNAGLAADDAAQKSINLTKRAADLASVFNTDVNQALQAIQAGLRGEIDPLERFGVTMNQAAIEAKALEKGIISAGEEMTAQQKVTARLATIMEQTADVQGDFANTSDQTANSLRVQKARATDLAAEFGQELLPVVDQALDVAGNLIDRFSGLSDAQKQAVVTTGAIAAGLGPVLFVMGKLVSVIPSVVSAIRTMRTAMIALNTVVRANPIGALASVIAALAGGALVAFISRTREQTSTQSEANEELKEATARFEELKEKSEQASQAIRDFESVGQDFRKILQLQEEREELERLNSQIEQLRQDNFPLTEDAVSDDIFAEYQSLQDEVGATEQKIRELKQALGLDGEEEAATAGQVYSNVLEELNTNLSEAARLESQLGNLYDEDEAKAEALEEAVNALAESKFDFSTRIQQLKNEYPELIALLEDGGRAARDTDEETEALGQQYGKLNRFVGELLPDSFKQMNAVVDANQRAFDDFGGSVSDANDEMEKLSDFQRTFGSLFGMSRQETIELKGAIDQLGQSLLELPMNAFTSAMDQFGETLGKTGNGMQALQEGLVAFSQAILEALPQIFLQFALAALRNNNLPLALGFLAASGVTAGVSGYVSGQIEAEQEEQRNAQGNAFEDGAVTAFARGGAFTNEVVRHPTQFRMASGMGLMGEAGPEAVMPLTRMSSGNLGVESRGAGSNVNVFVSVENNSKEEVSVQESESSEGKRIHMIVGQSMKDHASKGTLDQPMKQRYGVSVQGRN